MRFWTTFSRYNIREILEDRLSKGAPFHVWQSMRSSRPKYAGRLISCTDDNCSLKLGSDYNNSDWQIVTDLPLFFHCEVGELLFRVDAFQLNGDVVRFKFPLELKITEKRKIERFPYKYQDFKQISYFLESKGKEKVFHDVLLDISVSGLGFVVHQDFGTEIPAGTNIFLTSITDQKLANPHKATVVHVGTYRYAKGTEDKDLLRIGVLFTDPLQTVNYRSIATIVERKQKRHRGLEVDGFNGLHPEEQERSLNVISHQNPQLAVNLRDRIDELDRLRYLTPKMKQDFLLRIELDRLAIALRMSSKELIYDLLIELTDRVRGDLLDKMNDPKPASAINKAQDEICREIRQMEKDGEIVLDPRSFVTYV